MALDHVSMWNESRGWTRISAEQADGLFAVTVSVNERVFLCDLCHQYVTFVKGIRQSSHFKHSRGESEKECADRSQAIEQDGQELLLKSITNPIRIIEDAKSFQLEIGFLPMPESILLQAQEQNMQVRVYAAKRLLLTKNIDVSSFSTEEVTYYPIGNICSDTYILRTTSQGESYPLPMLNRDFPGLNSFGTLFEKTSRRRIPIDGDVVVDKEYYLLTSEYIGHPWDISITKLLSVGAYTLYNVSAQKITKETTGFFFTFRCRLTSAPSKLIPIWPVLHEGEHFVETNNRRLFFLHKGDSSLCVDPPHMLRQIRTCSLDTSDGAQLVSIDNVSFIRMLLAARLSVLRYMTIYYTQNYRDYVPVTRYEEPDIYTHDQQPLTGGIHSSLPRRNCLYLTAKYDGKVIRTKRGMLYYSAKLRADETVVLDGIQWGERIVVYQGLDVATSLLFERERIASHPSDESIYRTLLSCKGRIVVFPQRYSWMISRMRNMPKTQAFLYAARRRRRIRQDALQIIGKHMGEG